MFKKYLLIVTTIIFSYFYTYSPNRHARRYTYIAKEDILNHMKFRHPENVSTALKSCTYQDIILENEFIEIVTITQNKSFQKPLSGGEFKPKHCLALIKTALIVPYRNRTSQLAIFINYMHFFLQKQNIHYRIFVANQNDTLPFNRAKMLNYGASLAMKLNYDCLVLHDVDLLPINVGNIYGCAKLPRHMSCNLDTFRYNLPYLSIFGGAISISTKQFKMVNGMSNSFYGWGGEDDDFYRRVNTSGLKPCRFDPEVNRYIMLSHKKQDANKNRFLLMKLAVRESENDGLNSLLHHWSIKLEDLYTYITVS
ncbi:hypothetical protein NQ315_004079 [Exocentrus adspersus]|uniref:Beta-1,4-N-acetylgalactosaminyltransferase n=1 Tax=Exocentrus adspersus TaxID=1586481 RepID=A0AAV8W6R9_9CUCU|nr:hypothetical protein NQ315_004079 [Exocentrus adspersus]